MPLRLPSFPPAPAPPRVPLLPDAAPTPGKPDAGEGLPVTGNGLPDAGDGLPDAGDGKLGNGLPVAPYPLPVKPEKIMGPQVGKAWPRQLRLRGAELFIAGFTATSVAEAIGIPPGTVGSWSRIDKWQKQRDVALAAAAAHRVASGAGDAGDVLAKLQAADLTPRSLTDLTGAGHSSPQGGRCRVEKLTLEQEQDIYREGMASFAARLPTIIAELTDGDVIRHADKLKALDALARKALGIEEAQVQAVINIGLMAGGLPPALPASRPSIYVDAEVVEQGGGVPQLSDGGGDTEEGHRVADPSPME